jgi:hypothetical protein
MKEIYEFVVSSIGFTSNKPSLGVHAKLSGDVS